ncbi:hypothetical protein ABZ636_38060 [Streptomyces sp. NPDC007251]
MPITPADRRPTEQAASRLRHRFGRAAVLAYAAALLQPGPGP